MLAAPAGNKASFTLLAFTPRQVLLGTQTMKQSSNDNVSSNATLKLKQEQKLLLHQSIARYLDSNGFPKTLKKFRSEAQIEKDNLEGSSVDLEEMCLKYLKICGKDAKSSINNGNEQGVHSKNKEGGNLRESTCKKKKKKHDKSHTDDFVHQSGSNERFNGSKTYVEKINGSVPESKITSKEKDTDNQIKEKKKKKSKLGSESHTNNMEDSGLESRIMVAEEKVKDDVSADTKIVNGAETEKRSRDKKKNKEKPSCHGVENVQIGDPGETVSRNEDFKVSREEVTDKEKKDSKKRKRQTSEENAQQVADRKVDEEPKRRKIENLNESDRGKDSEKTNANLGNDLNSYKESFDTNCQVEGDQLQKTLSSQSNGKKLNGDLVNTGDKSSVQRSHKKQEKGSAEPKSVNAFQRVKVDKVVFADERLQDNSYWAKNGAENGYGAKAEEILGQVRGRDFRHEKTKKKRGTYRGGQIDLQSHSIKFNDSDDD